MPLFGLKWAEQEQANRYQFCKTSFGKKVPWASSNLPENLTDLTMVDGNLCLWIISYVARRTISYVARRIEMSTRTLYQRFML